MTREEPYQGLMPYAEEDAPFFFGREREGRNIADNLLASPLTVVYGESGVGKSSVLRAEVVSALRRLAARNRSQRGVPELAVVVVSDWIQPRPEISDEPALRALGEEAGGDVLVILDQFEEYFLYHPDEDDDAFGAAFPRLVERPGLRANFLISIREDALAKLDRFKGRIPGLLDNLLRLDRLDRAAGRAAIVEPLKLVEGDHGPLDIEPELVEAVLEQVATGNVVVGGAAGTGAAREPVATTIEAPYLQLVMSRVWAEERALGSRVLRHETLVRLGGAARIVDTHVDAMMSAFDESERDVAARIFHQLVTPSGAKIAHTVADLAQLSDQTVGQVAPVVDRLAGGEMRILRPVAGPDTGTGRVELFHDVLAHAVLDWRARHVRDQRERALEEERRLAEEQRRRELKYRFVLILALALLVAVIGTAALTVFAVRERDRARSSALVAHSVAAVDDPELAVLLAREGIERSESDDAAEALVAGLSQLHLLATMRGSPDSLVATTRDGSAFTPDGTLVVTAAGNSAALWSVATGARVHSLEGHRDQVFTAAFNPDGTRVVTASEDGTAKIWAARSGELVHTLQGPPTGVNGAQFSRDGRLVLASGGFAATVGLWSTATGRPVRTIRTRAPVFAAAFDRTGERVVTSEADAVARVWDAGSGRLNLELRGHRDAVYGASFDSRGRRIVTSSLDGTARLWNARTGTHVARLGAIAQAAPATFSPDGRLVLTTADRAAHVWRASTGARVASLHGHGDALTSSSFSPDGTRVATASEDQTAIVWDVAAEGPVRVLRGHAGRVMSAVFTPSGDRLVTASEDRTARTWDTSPSPVLRAHRGAVLSVAFSPDGRLLVSGGEDGTARLWRVSGARPLGVPFRHQGSVNRVAFSPDGSQVLTAGDDRTAALWDVRTGAEVRRFGIDSDEPGDAVNAAAFRPDGDAVILATAFSGVQVFDARSGRRLRVLPHEGVVYDAAFSSDGGRVVTADIDGTARIWDVAGRRSVVILRGHAGSVLTAAFSPDDRFVVTAGSDRTAMVWDAETGSRLRVLDGHTARVSSARFSPDGRRIVTAGDTTTRVWDARSGRLLGIVSEHADVVLDAVQHDDLIASASEDGTVRLYRCRTCVAVAELPALAARRVTRSLTAPERQRFVDEE